VTGPNPDSLAAAQKAHDDSMRAAQDEADRRAREEAERQRRIADSLAAIGKSTEAVKTLLATLVHFDFDKANIRGDDGAVLDQKVGILQANPGLRIRVAGHCDERGSDEYNLALGNRRAIAAKQYLVSHGVDAGRIETASNGKEKPLDPGHTEESWAKNRNDQTDIAAGGDALKQP
jgi:peptidoglycan-associated lipoprotein